MGNIFELVSLVGAIAKAFLIAWAIIAWIFPLFYKRIKAPSCGRKYVKAWTYGCCVHFTLAMIFAYLTIGNFNESTKLISNGLYHCCFLTFGLFIIRGKTTAPKKDETYWKLFVWSLASCLYLYFWFKFNIGLQNPTTSPEFDSVSTFVLILGCLQVVVNIGCLTGILTLPFLPIWVLYKVLRTIFKNMFG